jgi:archaellum component FlaC
VGYGWSVPPIESPDPYPTPRTSSYLPVVGVEDIVTDVSAARKEKDLAIPPPNKETWSKPQQEVTHPPKSKKHTRPHSPAPQPHRKRKSKYSPYTPEVEKALSVITAELEKNSRTSASTLSLENTIQTLEQRLRMRDQEIVLLKRERDGLKSEAEGLRKEVEKGKGEVKRVEGVLDDVRRDRVAEIRKRMAVEEERDGLRLRVEELEREGREWKGRLRELVGGSDGTLLTLNA